MMNFLLANNWLLTANSFIFWLVPIVLAIHLAIAKDQPNNYKKKLGYIYGTMWAIAFMIYLTIFLT